jgi:thiamine-phosphate pyrophosphorylase
MQQSCLLYYITDRTAFAADEPTRCQRLLDKIAEAARAGVGYIQLREKDLPARELESLGREAVAIIDQLRTENRDLKTALLINSRTDIALATGADGVHLRSNDISPEAVRAVWGASHARTAAPACPAVPSTAVVEAASGALPRSPLIGISCHSPRGVIQAAQAGASFAVFAPIFEKKDSLAATPAGVKLLEQACRASIPVLALGGITLENAPACLHAGAAGIAAIRLFQENDIATIVRQLRG